MTDTPRKRYALTLTPRDPEGMPLTLMGEVWQSVEAAAERCGYRAFFLDETGLGVAWFEEDD